LRETSVKKVLIKVVPMALLVFTFLIMHIWVRMQFVTESFKLSSLRAELKGLEATRAMKQVLRDTIYKPQNLERLNKVEGFGFTLPEKNQVIELEAGLAR